MKQLKFKITPAPAKGSNLYVSVQPRKWYIAWIYMSAFFRATIYVIKNK